MYDNDISSYNLKNRRRTFLKFIKGLIIDASYKKENKGYFYRGGKPNFILV